LFCRVCIWLTVLPWTSLVSGWMGNWVIGAIATLSSSVALFPCDFLN
jgi:hypothetical protein